ncbi:MAG: hypothetical protein KF767_03150 [Bdellovibrionaceae bacterium]|nr:hypothetical protein [Pseudobdellovibrionaceae bacterium]
MRFLTYALLLILVGCKTTQYGFRVKALAREQSVGEKAFVICVNDDDSELQRDEYKRQAEVALADAGFRIVRSIAESDVVVAFT